MFSNKLLVVVLALVPALTMAQTVPYKVIFDITSSDSAAQKAVIRQMRGISQSRPDAQLEVAIYGDALGMAMKDKSIIADAVQELTSNKKASFKVCAATMKRNNIDKSQLLPGVDVVPDAIYEIVTKQHEGWGYIKVAQ
ncbi:MULTISPECIES: DsrE family protein [Niastella]|uniref:DsrE family protein n=1 Tax=Niastella soli TaxID=2821487 RepID=A0ABS3YPU0_9BACT|nr:DsrE family protein [Niastella soli]MBO9199919.1 DsrE family protein [Niastella soli]